MRSEMLIFYRSTLTLVALFFFVSISHSLPFVFNSISIEWQNIYDEAGVRYHSPKCSVNDNKSNLNQQPIQISRSIAFELWSYCSRECLMYIEKVWCGSEYCLACLCAKASKCVNIFKIQCITLFIPNLNSIHVRCFLVIVIVDVARSSMDLPIFTSIFFHDKFCVHCLLFGFRLSFREAYVTNKRSYFQMLAEIFLPLHWLSTVHK